MKFDVLTLFPEMFEPLKQSIIGRAEEKELIDINFINYSTLFKTIYKFFRCRNQSRQKI